MKSGNGIQSHDVHDVREIAAVLAAYFIGRYHEAAQNALAKEDEEDLFIHYALVQNHKRERDEKRKE